MVCKNNDAYEYNIFDEMRGNNLLEQFFGVAKCHLVLDKNVNEDFKGPQNYEENDSDELTRLLLEKDVLTESKIFIKNGNNEIINNLLIS